MQARHPAFKPRHASDWSKERIEKLTKQEIEQLRINAGTLGESEVATLCEEVLRERPKATRRSSPAKAVAHKHPLISRRKAFEARGVQMEDVRTSWSGVRKSDGKVVMTLWAQGVESKDGGCCYLLWAPNVKGSRPWTDSVGGKERLEHCKLAMASGSAEGLLVHGQRLEGHIPEDRTRSVQGVDPETVVHFQIEKRGEEYWATWGKKLT